MNKYLFLLTLFPVIARGQDTAVSCATNQKCAHILATFSLGAINAYRDNYSLPQGFEKNNVSGFLPLYAKLEYGITHHTGLAATFGYDAFIINYNQLYQGHDGMVKRYRSNAVTTLSAGASLFYHVVPFERIKRVDPFVGLGFSLNNVRQSAHPQGDSIVAIRENLISPYIKAGVRYYLSYNFSLFADAGYDKRSIVTLGASVRMGKPPRNMPADSDNDGIPDRVDSCRYASGPAAMNGCPDSDGDGIADIDDRCPLAAGPAYAHGCPDTDNDGVPDEYDNCPTFAGRLRGCPDSDGDGIADADDKCPNQVGYPEYNGCPDTDNDGTPDNDDACPLLAGPVYKHGCPDTVVKKDLTLEKDRITFITGKATLTPASYPVLDQAFASVITDSTIYIMVDGYADNTGNASVNKVISTKRALAIKKYFTRKGIPAYRVIAIGHGSKHPVASNRTAAGRAKNRRATLKLRYNDLPK